METPPGRLGLMQREEGSEMANVREETRAPRLSGGYR
jgi:hypothetical protein